MTRRQSNRSIPLVICILIWASVSSIAFAADDNDLTKGRAELRRAIISLAPRASLDTTPVEFSVGGVNYRMPRNYLVSMENWAGGPQGLVEIQINLPTMGPITVADRDCFTNGELAGSPGCDPLLVIINSPGGPSAEEAFTRTRPLFRNPEPIQGSFGFEKYELGPDSARYDYYRKMLNGRTLLYSCHEFENHGKRDGQCDPIGDRLGNGDVLQFYFRLRQLPEMDRIHAAIREMVESFTIQTGDRK